MVKPNNLKGDKNMEYKRYGGNEDLYQSWKRNENESPLKVIMEGEYRGRHFVIGAHCTGNPNAYLEVDTADAIYCESEKDEYYDGGLNSVNGGSTYFGEAYWANDDTRTYVGWDYGHCRDYCARYPELGGRKWTLIDILMEIASAENEIDNANSNDPDYVSRQIKSAMG